jgi:predicted phosphodiesterase
MKIGITKFIPENIAPENVSKLVIFNENEKVGTVDISNMQPSNLGNKLYSFGLLSDIHLYKKGEAWVNWSPDTKFDNALSYFENQGCAFCAHCGDFTQTGLYDEGDTVNLQPAQFAYYKEICDKHIIPVYGCCGNHESYVVPIENNLTELEYYTGTNLYYTIEQGNDLFIFIGQPYNICPMSDEALQWLYETLEANRNRRCFIFVHPQVGIGDLNGAYTENLLFKTWKHLAVFKRLMSHYKNTILFHGHTHTDFEAQEVDEGANFSMKDGFRSVHIPTLSKLRSYIDGVFVNRYEDGQGYLVDVYADCVVLNGMDLINKKPVPLGVYKIDTTLQTIAANTFTDSTGTITT